MNGAGGTSKGHFLDETNYLIRLEATRNTILVDATAAIRQAAFTDVLSAAGSVNIAAAVNQQVFPFTNITCDTEGKHSDRGCYNSV